LKDFQQRLSVIHFVHGKSASLELSIEQVGHIWKVLSTPPERELCLQFLSQAGVRNPPKLCEAFDLNVCEHVFRELVCKQTDFSTIGKQGYQVQIQSLITFLIDAAFVVVVFQHIFQGIDSMQPKPARHGSRC
jgi:hypothetical protein